MAGKSRRKKSPKRAAYKVRSDQRSDPGPKSKLARKLAKLTPPNSGTGVSPVHSEMRRKQTGETPVPLHDPDGALYAYDNQKALAYADAPDVARIEAQPFLKWAGGKAQLLTQFDKFFPPAWPTQAAPKASPRREPLRRGEGPAKIDRYFEPFIGGGAVFFHLKRRFPKMRAFLRDNNAELINTYIAVRDCPNDLMRALDDHLRKFNADRERYYYLVRSQHHPPSSGMVAQASLLAVVYCAPNSQAGTLAPPNEMVERAARMIAANDCGFACPLLVGLDSSDSVFLTRFTTFHVACFNPDIECRGGEFNVPIGSDAGNANDLDHIARSMDRIAA